MNVKALVALAKEKFGFIERGADSDISLGIRNFESVITDRYSRKSTWFSLPQKVGEYIDDPFESFISGNNLSAPQWNFSKLVGLELPQSDRLLVDWSREIKEKAPNQYPHVLHTVDALRRFLRLCAFFKTGKIEILRLGDDGDLQPSYYQPRKKGKQIVDKLPEYLRFDHEEYCELCFKKTASQEKFDEIARLDNGLDAKVSDFINRKVKFSAKGFSPKYCVDHQDPEKLVDDNGKKKSKKKGIRTKLNKRRIHFYSAIRMIEDIGEANRSIGIETDLLRQYAYWLVFYPSRMSSKLKCLPSIIAKYQIERHKGIDELTLLLQKLEAESNSKKSWTQKCLINEPINLKRQTDVEWMQRGILLQQSLLARKLGAPLKT